MPRSKRSRKIAKPKRLSKEEIDKQLDSVAKKWNRCLSEALEWLDEVCGDTYPTAVYEQEEGFRDDYQVVLNLVRSVRDILDECFLVEDDE